MLEQEIKLYVPPASRKEIAAQLALPPAKRRMRFRAMYFDTADRQLAKQCAAIRLRQEGRKWVQTFKMAGANSLSRIELNHPRPGPELDLSVYAGTPAQAVFDKLDQPLLVRYETDVMRATRQLRTRYGLVELAYDVGAIRAQDLELPIDEVEFELLSGRQEALFVLAGRWMRKHGLVLDVRSKAERGDGLASAAIRIAAAAEAEKQAVREAEIARFWEPAGAGKIRLDAHASPGGALEVVTAECLDQIVRNATALAAVDDHGDSGVAGAEHVHQLRVGMRRLRSAWRLFDGWTPLPDQALRDAANRHFAAFGAVRDQDVGGTLVPVLLKAGMPPVGAAAEEGIDPGQLAAGPDFQCWLLGMVAWSVGVRPTPPAPAAVPQAAAQPASQAPLPADRLAPAAAPKPRKLQALVSQRLRKWHKRLTADGGRFHELQDEQRHTLRKRAKRLRYALSFTESLYGAHRVKPYRQHLAQLQDVLGDVNDLVVARAHYASLTDTHPQAWFALGWIAARLEELYARAEACFKELAGTRPFWK